MIVVMNRYFDKLQELGELPIDKPIKIHYDENIVYAISPDGTGCYYYDSLEELREEHL